MIAGLSGYQYGDSDPNGPHNWGKLDCTNGEYAQFSGCSYCKNECGGDRQSPVDITPATAVQESVVNSPNFILSNSAELAYAITPQNYMLTCENGWCGSARYDGQFFRLIQAHLHAPAEHSVNGKLYPLELHLVHISDAGQAIVLAVFFEEGKENPALGKFFDVADKRCRGKIDFMSIVGTAKQRWRFISYLGSLTNPPCNEIVRFAVSRNVQQASKEQIAQYIRQVGNMPNNRPVMPLNGRVLQSFN